jgi:hypothetical protein
VSRSLLVPPTLAVLLVIAPAAPVPREKPAEGLFHATTVGTKWVYEETHGGPPKDDVYTVSSVEERGGKKLVTVRWHRFNKDGTDVRVVEVSAGGLAVTVTPASAKRLNREWAEVWLKLPAKAGDRWQTKSLAGHDVTRTVVGVERIEVPAGKFEAVRVDYEFVNRRGVNRGSVWYAVGVGMVKQETTEGPGEGFSQVLKTFAPGGK